jgi:RHS repeat-associated protein
VLADSAGVVQTNYTSGSCGARSLAAVRNLAVVVRHETVDISASLAGCRRNESRGAGRDSLDAGGISPESGVLRLLKTETYAYDANGNLLTVTDRKSQVTEFRYDALDRQTFAGFGRTGTPPNYSFQSTIGYTYDAGNRLRTAVDSASGTITRDYDNLDRLFSETTGQGVVTYQFDLAGRRTQQQVAGQTAVTYGYDNADRLQTITQGASVVGFGYDDADRRTSLTLPGSLEVLYGYDDASQLLSLTYKRSGATTGDLAYTYDASGRRATTSGSYARLNLPAAQSTTTYNANNQLTKWGNKTLSYDLNGNMLGDLNNAFSWNARDQLSAVTKTGQTLPSFTYDAFGRRQKKTLGATVTSYLYDGANAVQELIGATPSANMLTGLGVDEVFQRTEGATPRAFLSDALGGTLALADSAGVVQTSYTYSPYGETTFTGTASNNTSQYTGRENDNDGLYYYRARYYHPVFSRFVSEDPLGFAAGDPNLYGYVLSNPISNVDPSGQIVPWIAACATSAAFSVGIEMISNSLAGRKNTLSSVAGTGASGCVAGMFGFGLGKAAIAGARYLAATKTFNQLSRSAHLTRTAGEGQRVFRVWGDASGPNGSYWTKVDPGTIANFRAAAGLPSGNTGRFVSEGLLVDVRGVSSGFARSGAGGGGGIPELFIPNPARQVQLLRVSGANPPF